MRSRINIGYTLVEVVMVLGIISIGALLFTPRVSGVVNAWNLDTEINKVKAKIRETQQLAIAEQNDYQINWDVSNTYYVIYRWDSSTFTPMEAPEYKNNVITTGTTFPITPGSLIFDEFGAPSDCGTIGFQQIDTMQNRTLKIHCVTGQLEVF